MMGMWVGLKSWRLYCLKKIKSGWSLVVLQEPNWAFLSTFLCHPKTRDRFEPICELRVCQGMTSDVPPFDSERVCMCVSAYRNAVEIMQYGVKNNTTFLECVPKFPRASIRWLIQRDNDRRKEVRLKSEGVKSLSVISNTHLWSCGDSQKNKLWLIKCPLSWLFLLPVFRSVMII